MELKFNQVVLQYNKNKPKSQPRGKGQPEFIGTINIDGTLRQIALWVKTAQSGDTYLLGNNAPIKEPVKPEKPIQSHEYKQSKDDGNLPF